jgi:hypothetical protein
VVGPEVGGRHAKRKRKAASPAFQARVQPPFGTDVFFPTRFRFFIEFPGPLGAIRGSIRNQSNDHHDQTDDDNCA